MNILRTFKLISLIQNKYTTYPEVVKFLFNDTPPENHNFLSHLNTEDIKRVTYSPIKKNRKQPVFSVIMATYNRGYAVLNAINAVVSQKNLKKEEFEIIIVDDGSDDDTQNKLAKFFDGTDIPKSTIINLKKNHGPSVARNIGLMHSKGVFTAFTDDDCIVPSDWLSEFKKAFQLQPEISGVGGWIKLDDKTSTLYDKIIVDVRLPYSRRSCVSTEYSHYNLCGDTANVCYKREAVIASGGFNPYFRFPTTEDWEMKIRMHKNKQTLAYVADRPVLNKKILNAASYRKFWLRHGWGCFLMSAIHPETKLFYNFTFSKAVKRTIKEIRYTINAQKHTSQLTYCALIKYSWLLAVRNFCLWLGKYWTPVFELDSTK